jgi:hypothetical protein
MRRMNAALLMLAPLLAIGALLAAGEILSAPAPALVGDAPAEYERRVAAFLAAHLRAPEGVRMQDPGVHLPQR